MPAEDPTLIAGSLSLAEAHAVVNADDTIIDPTLAEEMQSLTRSVPPVALPSLPPPPVFPRPPVADATHLGFVGAALAAAAVFVGLLAVPHVMVRRDHTWVTPATLTPSDPRVIEVADALAEADRKRADLDDAKDRLAERLREVEAQETPPDDEATRRSELVRRRAEAKKLHEAIDERDRLNLPPSTELRAKLKATDEHIKALKAARKSVSADTSRTAERQELRTSLAALDAALVANEQHRKALDALPYRAAVDGDVVLAFVPAENDAHVRNGMTLRTCRWGNLLCRDVGTVTGTFDLEVDGTNPIAGEATRGHFVAVTWTDPSAARRRLLFSR
jgi:hypothetical protein